MTEIEHAVRDTTAPARVALVAACMARGCTPDQTGQVMRTLQYLPVPLDAADLQRALEAAIHDAGCGRPEPIEIHPPTIVDQGQRKGRP